MRFAQSCRQCLRTVIIIESHYTHTIVNSETTQITHHHAQIAARQLVYAQQQRTSTGNLAYEQNRLYRLTLRNAAEYGIAVMCDVAKLTIVIIIIIHLINIILTTNPASSIVHN